MTASASSLVARAYAARTARTRAKHARAAIAIDPDRLEAYMLLGDAADDPAERLTVLRQGAERGRVIWAHEIADPEASHFWLDHDTRPFMRILHLLALERWNAGDTGGAIAEAEAMLRLNPNDNQGIRDLLVDWYGAIGAWDACAGVLDRYPDDGTTSHEYTRWLLAYRDGAPTDDLLASAMAVNAHVAHFLSDPDAAPDVDADNQLAAMGYVALGSPEEARDYADSARVAWSNVAGAIEQLGRDVATRGTQ